MKVKFAFAMLLGAAFGIGAIEMLHAQAKPPAYLIADITVNNEALFKEWADKINPTFAFMPSPSFPPALLFVVVWPPNSDHFQTQVGWHLIRSENSWVTRARLKSREFGRRAQPGTNRRSIRDSIEFYAKPYRQIYCAWDPARSKGFSAI